MIQCWLKQKEWKDRKRDKEHDELNALREKLDAQEAEAKNSEMILENKKALFLSWTLERMQKEAINELNTFWLEPKTSFDINNDVKCQLDFPITPRAFLFRCFEKIDKSLISNNATNRKLFLFYLKYAKPQYEPWSLKRIVGLKVCIPVQI